MSTEVDEEEGMTLIRVTVCNSHTMSTILKTYPSTTAQDLNSILSTKLDINESAKYFVLILVYTINTDTHGKRHIIRTIDSNEKVLDVVKRVEDKFQKKSRGDDGAFSSFYFKDIRTAPLEFDNDVSGTESSDEDEEIDASDFNYLKQFKSSYMLVQSCRDSNLFKRRWCVLGEKLWAISLSKQYPRSKVLSEFNSLVYNESQNSITVSGNVNITMVARSEAELNRWVDDLKHKAINKADNDIIYMAEMIISDEEYTRDSRMQSILPEPPISLVHPEIFEARERPINFDILKEIRVIDKQATYHTALCKAIQNYRELFRHDIKRSVEPWYQYYYALKILRTFGFYIKYRYGSECYNKMITSIKILEREETSAESRNQKLHRGTSASKMKTSTVSNGMYGSPLSSNGDSFVDRLSKYWNGESSATIADVFSDNMAPERKETVDKSKDDNNNSSSSSSSSSGSSSSSKQFNGQEFEETKYMTYSGDNENSNDDGSDGETLIGEIVNLFPRSLVSNCYEIDEPAVDIFDSICISAVSKSRMDDNACDSDDADDADEPVVIVVDGRTELDTSFS